MSVKIRLKRMGTKKVPFFRIVVADSRAPRDGRFIEELGYYNPLTEPKLVKIDNEKALEWMKKGARPSETVERLFRDNGVFDQKEEQIVEVIEVIEEIEEEIEEVIEEIEEEIGEAIEEEIEEAIEEVTVIQEEDNAEE